MCIHDAYLFFMPFMVVCIPFRSSIFDICFMWYDCYRGKRIHCSLWDQYAIRMDAHLTVHDPNSPVVVILHLGKLKKYYGAMGVSNAFYGTKLILNDDFSAVKEYRSK